MKRLYIALALLSAAIIFSISSYFTINKKIDKIIELMESDREITIMTTEPDEARTKAITDAWEENETYLVSMLTHQELEEVEIGIMCLPDYLNQGFTEEYIKTLNECINHLYHIKETEKADTKNIF